MDVVEQVGDDNGLIGDVGHGDDGDYYDYSIVNSANDDYYCYIDVKMQNLCYLLDRAIRSLGIRNIRDRRHKQRMQLLGILTEWTQEELIYKL